jgi:signal transduction histidine kinase/ActR/RegA family two-component response regulator
MNPELSVDATRLPSALVRWFSDLTYQGMFATDRDLRVIVWNRWMEIHTGRAAASVLGRALFEIHPDLVARGMDQYYRDALAGQVSVISYGLHRHLMRLAPTNLDLGFNEMPQSARIGPLSDGDEVIGTVTTVEDISDRLASEAELRKQIEVQRIARNTAEKALRVKDEFLSTVSHEMRNPLNAVLGWTRILIDRKDVSADMLAGALRVIDRNATAQARMIDDLLDVARISAGKLRLDMEPVDFRTVTLAAVDLVLPAARTKQIEVRTTLDPKTRPVLGDQHRLQQIVSNLLSNAVKFTEPGGVVEVRLMPAGKLTRLVVSDTGHGISPDFLPFVFERFQQSDSSSARRHGGLGLGLALVRELVELHGGTVRAESPGEHRGATFTVDLPTAPAFEDMHTRSARDTGDSMDSASLGGVRVLVVEDENDSRELLTEVLSKCGAAVSAVASCEEALEVIRASSAEQRPHVVVSDLGMPDEDGYDLIRQLRALRPEQGGPIPAVAVTGYANPDDRKRVLAAGYHGHVPKPIDAMTVVTAVARAVGQADTTKSVPR